MTSLQGDYDKAVEYFGRCYEICSHLDNADALYSARVQYGIAKGHKFMGGFSALVTNPTTEGIQQLAVWKDARVIASKHSAIEGEEEEEEEEEPGSGREGLEERGDEETEEQRAERAEGRTEAPTSATLSLDTAVAREEAPSPTSNPDSDKQT